MGFSGGRHCDQRHLFHPGRARSPGAGRAGGASLRLANSVPRRPRPLHRLRGAVQEFAVRVTERGFEPATIRTRKGQAVRLTFTRTTDATCAKEVVVPTLKIRRALPLDEYTQVTVEFTTQDQDVAFACGMNMLRGSILVQ